MQMIERPWGVTVYGAASVRAVPDVVRIRFKVSRLERTPDGSFLLASEGVRSVRQALRDHGVADAAVNRSQLGLKSEFEYKGQQRQFLGYQCEASFAVESGDLDGLQGLLVDLVAAGANEIDSLRHHPGLAAVRDRCGTPRCASAVTNP